jgi:hypothetical protein
MRRAAILIIAFFAWIGAFRLIVEAPMIYFMSRSGARFQEIVDTSSSNQVIFVGLASLAFLIFLTQINPVLIVSRSEVWSAHQFEELFYPAFLRGAILSATMVLLFLGLGYYRYVGFFIQSDTPLLAILTLFARFLAVLSMVYAEEFVFRKKFLSLLKNHMHPLQVIGITALLFTLAKAFQFHLGWAHLFTLSLLGCALGLRAYISNEFGTGAGLLAGFLVATYCLFSIPILGNESQGLLLLKYQIRFDIESPAIRLFTGGSGGLLSSVALQLVLMGDIGIHFFKNKKMILSSAPTT